METNNRPHAVAPPILSCLHRMPAKCAPSRLRVVGRCCKTRDEESKREAAPRAARACSGGDAAGLPSRRHHLQIPRPPTKSPRLASYRVPTTTSREGHTLTKPRLDLGALLGLGFRQRLQQRIAAIPPDWARRPTTMYVPMYVRTFTDSLHTAWSHDGPPNRDAQSHLGETTHVGLATPAYRSSLCLHRDRANPASRPEGPTPTPT